ncbi:putative membrane protein [Elusimicrobium simillimum]|uniref:hypothetical protein n=1 Tax=Elusimicrobium simillimum TaxID=3143438 RepID=UPI003C6EC47F
MDILKKKYPVLDILTESFNAFWKNLKGLYIIQLLLMVAVMIMSIPYLYSFFGVFLTSGLDFNNPQAMDPAAAEALFKQMFSPAMIVYLVVAMLAYVVFALVQKAAVSIYLQERILGREITILDAFKRGLPRAWSLFITAVVFLIILYAPIILIILAGSVAKELMGLLIFVWFIALFFGVFFFIPLVQVVVLKGKSLIDALKYCVKLVKPTYWPTMGFMFLIMAIAFALMIGLSIVNGITQAIFGLLAAATQSIPVLSVIFVAVSVIISFLIMLIPYCYMDVPFVLYYMNREVYFGDGQGELAELAKQNAPAEVDVNLMPAPPQAQEPQN